MADSEGQGEELDQPNAAQIYDHLVLFVLPHN